MHEYDITIGGLPHTVLLDEETAAERGLTRKAKAAPANKAAPAPANKERELPNKARDAH